MAGSTDTTTERRIDVTVGVVSRTESFLEDARSALPEMEFAFQFAHPGSLELDATPIDALLLHHSDADEVGWILKRVPPELPVVALLARGAGEEEAGEESAGELARREGTAILSEPWTWREVEAAIILAVRGGRYRDSRYRDATAEDEIDGVGVTLTPRERDVLQKLSEGWSNRGIALSLGISENTVKYHLSAIFRKLGAEGRTEAVVIALQDGILAL